MNKKFPAVILAFCFGLSNANISLAAEMVNMPQPVSVNPNDLQALSQKTLNGERQNRDQEMMIRQLIEENNQLMERLFINRRSLQLERINEDLMKYRNGIITRDREQIANLTPGSIPSREELIGLSLDVEAMKRRQESISQKQALIEQKGEDLAALKNQVLSLNEILKAKDDKSLKGDEAQKQISLLTQKLVEADAKIAQYDVLLAKKDAMIAQLKDQLVQEKEKGRLQNQAIQKQDETIAAINKNLNQLNEEFAKKASFLREEIQKQSRMIDSKNEIILSLQNQLNEAKFAGLNRVPSTEETSRLDKLHEEIKSLESELSARMTNVGQMENSLKSLNMAEVQTLKSKDIEIARLKERLALLKTSSVSQMPVANISVQELQNEVKVLKSNLTSKLIALDELQVLVQTLQQREVEYKNNLSQKDQMIQSKDAEIAQLQERLNSSRVLQASPAVIMEDQGKLNGQISQMSNQLRKQVQELSFRDAKIADLKERFAAFKMSYVYSPSAEDKDSLKKFQEEVKNLKNDLVVRLKDISQKDDEIVRLKEKFAAEKSESTLKDEAMLTQFQKEVKVLKSNLSSRLSSLQELEVLVKSSQEKEENLKVLLSQKEEMIALKDKEIAQLQESLSAVDALKEEVNVKSLDIKRLTNQVGQLSKKTQEQISLINSRDEEVANLKTRLAEAKFNLDKQDPQDAVLLAQLKSQTKELKKDLNNRLTSLEELAKSTSELQSETEDLKSRLNAQAKTIIMKDQQIVTLEENLKQMATLKDETKSKLDDIARLQESIEQLNKAIEEKDRSLLKDKNALSEVSEKYIQLQSNMKLAQELVDLQQQQAKLLEEKNNLRLRFGATLDGQLTTLKAQFKEVTDDQDKKLNENLILTEDLKKQLAVKEEQVSVLKEEIKNKIAESSQMTTMLDVYQKKLETKNSDYNQKLKDAMFVQKRQDELGKTIAELNTRLQDQEAQIIKMKEEAYQLQKSNEEKDKDLQAKDLSLSMLQDMTGTKARDFEAQMTRLKEEAIKQKMEVESIRQQLVLAQQSAKDMVNRSDVDQVKKSLEEAKMQLKDKDTALLSLQASFDASMKDRSQVDQWAKQLKDKEDQLLKSQAALNVATKDYSLASASIVELKKKLDEANRQLKTKDSGFDQLKSSLSSQEQGLNDQLATIKKLENQIKALKSDLAMSREDVAYKLKEIARLKNPNRVIQPLEKTKVVIKEVIKEKNMSKAGIDADVNLTLKEAREKIYALKEELRQVRSLLTACENDVVVKPASGV